jgi:hypothetical protein
MLQTIQKKLKIHPKIKNIHPPEPHHNSNKCYAVTGFIRFAGIKLVILQRNVNQANSMAHT